MDEKMPLLGQLRVARPASVRDVWPSEPAHFTPWLAEHLDLLGTEVGLGPLELVGTEVSIPNTGRALDILASLSSGELVAIENQFATADHDHLTRGLAYAVGLNAAALVLVAENHLGEFRAVASYLNTLAERSDAAVRIGVYLVALSAEQIEEYVVPRLRLIESPNPWLQAASASTPGPLPETVEEFLNRVPDASRLSMTHIVEWWSSHSGGTVSHRARRSVGLNRPHPVRARQALSHALLNDDGTYTIQRGYLLDSGAVSAEESEEFDVFLRRTFPHLSWTGKHYYLNSNGPPDPDAFRALVGWLADAARGSTQTSTP